MLLQYGSNPTIKLEDRRVYSLSETVHLPSSFHNAGSDSVLGWDWFHTNNNSNSNNNNNNNNINNVYFDANCPNDYNNNNNNNNNNNLDSDHNSNFNEYKNNITTLDFNNNNNNNNYYYSYCNKNRSNTKVILDLGERNSSSRASQNGFHYNIPVFLSSIKAEQTPHTQPNQSHLHQQSRSIPLSSSSSSISSPPPSSLSPSSSLSSLSLSPLRNMPSAASVTTAVVMADSQSSPLSSTSSNATFKSEPSSEPAELSPSSSSSPPPSSSQIITPSSPILISLPSSVSLSSSSLSSSSSSLSSSTSSSSSSPSSVSRSSLSTTITTPSSFSETNYSPSRDKLYLVNNFTRSKSILFTPNDDHSPTTNTNTNTNTNSSSNNIAIGSLNMMNILSDYNAENIQMGDHSDIPEDCQDMEDTNSHSLFGHWNTSSSDFFSRKPLPDIWSTFGHSSPKSSAFVTGVNCDVTNMHLMTSDTLDDDDFSFVNLRDVSICPLEDEIITNFLNEQSPCSDEDEDGSQMMSDCGYSSDHTTTQSSPTSIDSSSDWSGTYENDPRLPVFNEIQQPVSTPESVKRPRKTPSPRQKRKSSDSPPTHERKKPGRKPGQVSNVLHLWEFMRDLLHDPSVSDGIIQWISKAEGVFRVVDSSEVARLWGQKKNNKKEMTYEKLSRSLRYSRLEGYFDNLPKDKNYPKKLCFKFGPKSRHFST